MFSSCQVKRAVRESFQLWQQHISDLDFKEERGDRDADIKIYFDKSEEKTTYNEFEIQLLEYQMFIAVVTAMLICGGGEGENPPSPSHPPQMRDPPHEGWALLRGGQTPISQEYQIQPPSHHI